MEASHPIRYAKNCGLSSRTICITACTWCRTASYSKPTSKLYASVALGKWIKIAFLSVEYPVSRTCKGLPDDWVSCLGMGVLWCNNFSFILETMCQHAPDHWIFSSPQFKRCQSLNLHRVYLSYPGMHASYQWHFLLIWSDYYDLMNVMYQLNVLWNVRMNQALWTILWQRLEELT